MPKCTYNRKHHLKGYRKCAITGQIMKQECHYYGSDKPPCKYFRVSLFKRFINWFFR